MAVYAVLALAATARAGYQLATDFSDAPLAYFLSALAAVIYILATYALTSRRPGAWRLAVICCSIEFVGVLAIGTASLIWTEDFPRATVWSAYGIGYGFLPLVLPVLGLLWLRRNAPSRSAG